MKKAHEFYERDHPQQAKFKYEHCIKELQGESQWAAQVTARRKSHPTATSASTSSAAANSSALPASGSSASASSSAVSASGSSATSVSDPPAVLVTVPAVSASGPSAVSISSSCAGIHTVHQDELPATTTKGKKRAAEEESLSAVLIERFLEFQDNMLKYQHSSLRSKKLDRLFECQTQDHKVIMELTSSTDPSVLAYFKKRKQEALDRMDSGFYDALYKLSDDSEEEK